MLNDFMLRCMNNDGIYFHVPIIVPQICRYFFASNLEWQWHRVLFFEITFLQNPMDQFFDWTARVRKYYFESKS